MTRYLMECASAVVQMGAGETARGFPYVRSSRIAGIRSAIARIGTGPSPDGNAPLTEPALTGSEGEPPPPKGAILDRKQLEFLATKLVPPRCEGLIPRPRLLDMVSQLSGKRLAMIKAPAGFGKTSLAAAWFTKT
jgi:hypothetical protein